MSAPTEIWWCDYHKAEVVDIHRPACWDAENPEAPGFHPCTRVRFYAVPESALVLLRDEEGQFLNFDSLLDVLEDMMHTRLIRYGIHERGRCASLAAMAVEVFADRLDALAAASQESL